MTPIALEFLIEGTRPTPHVLPRRSSIYSGRGNKGGDTGSVSSGKEGDQKICSSCGYLISSCQCKCYFCGTSFITGRHHCRKCMFTICEKCGERTDDGWMCKNEDACDKASHQVLRVMVKNGDDVRQDQMVIQIIRLMNKLLSDVNLDLCLSPYDVVAMK